MQANGADEQLQSVQPANLLFWSNITTVIVHLSRLGGCL
jgi:hypothetical protein